MLPPPLPARRSWPPWATTRSRPAKSKPEEIAAALKQLTGQLRAQRRTLEAYLAAQSITEADLRRQIAWNVAWEKFLTRYATRARMEAHFQAHHRDYDGTELTVSHILLRTSPGNDPAALERLVKQAQEIRQEILSGRLSFADAAQKYSEGPSRGEGGRLGAIGRHGPMDETFCRAAFLLDAGQISPPVRTVHGIHLIRCDEVRPGGKKLSAVRKEVETDLGRELMEKLSELQRRSTPVTYTGRLPHFKPGTHELAPP
ncbi:MAG: peptidylprolyl isomerase [Thermoguttaceae bacterium]